MLEVFEVPDWPPGLHRQFGGGGGGTPRGLNLRLGLKMVQSLYCRPSTNIDPPAAMWRGGMHLTLAVVKGDISDHKSTTVRN